MLINPVRVMKGSASFPKGEVLGTPTLVSEFVVSLLGNVICLAPLTILVERSIRTIPWRGRAQRAPGCAQLTYIN
ncbi:hypothetical protein BOTBODRAFT_595285 [Botryobasidium botryosum FD-172 SS1]|uniref:Uncharacterized protein n=1 Tax=Botryobasidium botryosum (strain FD-172 SS1) TaxID=930990 RepID=A0A067M7Y2_BOTB1|nr:hypothetical protein BOTBODRAFT_595285 [Botryobasidium botryosum FD-172 SS1]